MYTNYVLGGFLAALIAFLFNKYFINVFDYWQKRGIPYVKGALPFFGNTFSLLILRKDFGGFCDETYKAYKGRSMVGFFQFEEPHLLIRDPEIIKEILISGFSNFHMNVVSLDPVLNPLMARNPSFVDGEDWKSVRSRLTVALMSSRKLKVLFDAVKRVCVKFDKYLEENVKRSKGTFEVDGRELFPLFTGEVVAAGGFGVEGDFFSNGNGPNSFKEAVTGLFDPTLGNIVNQTVLFSVPVLNKILNFRFIPERTTNFFRGVVSEIIKVRQKDGIPRQDFLQLMIDTQKAKGEEINVFDITVSASSFFLDGYETSAATLAFFAYQVAANSHVQDKLRREVTKVLEKYDGELTYEAINDMDYMEQALNESMRLYPALYFLEKRCNTQYKIVGHDGLECIVEPGTAVVIPLHGLHTDPEYWENPEVYDPERFSEENKANRPKYVFLPFGEGPRICAGMRFGVLQVKAAMATMLRNYRIEVSPKTKLPLRVKAMPFLTAVQGGLWLTFKPL